MRGFGETLSCVSLDGNWAEFLPSALAWKFGTAQNDIGTCKASLSVFACKAGGRGRVVRYAEAQAQGIMFR